MPWYSFPAYVPVAERRRRGAREAARRVKKGQKVEPVTITGRVIAQTFWGKAWCLHLESYSDFANRLPRGRSYARNGSIVHLAVEKGRVVALVQGSELYEVTVTIAPLARPRWTRIVGACSGHIDSAVELLQGRLSSAVMQIVTDRERGLFPAPPQIEMRCSCPDAARMCKHIAAALYGVGARLDMQPELLFVLRAVDHVDLIGTLPTRVTTGAPRARGKGLEDAELAGIFGIEIEQAAPRRGGKRGRTSRR